MAETIEEAVTAAQLDPISAPGAEELAALVSPLPSVKPLPSPEAPAAPAAKPAPSVAPTPRPRPVQTATAPPALEEPERIVVTRLSTSGDRHWGINIGRFTSRNQAERVLLKTALAELGTLDTALRKVASSAQGHDANFVGMTREGAAMACLRLQARNIACSTIGPG